MKYIALITGATSGIGEATALALADSYHLIICGRRKDRLDKLANVLKMKTDVTCLNFDIRDQGAVKAAIEGLDDTWRSISVLINNAGNAHGLHYIHEGSTEDWDAMIDINVKGLLYVSRAVIPQMVAKQEGHIINIGSTAGIDVYPRGNVYNASKFAVDALTKGMRMDLNPYNIKVSEIKPGLVETEFSMVRFKGDGERSKQVYEVIEALQAIDIAECISFVLSRPKHVTIADMVVMPLAQASSTILNRKK